MTALALLKKFPTTTAIKARLADLQREARALRGLLRITKTAEQKVSFR